MNKWIKATRKPDSDRQVLICPGHRTQVSIGRYESRVDAEGVWLDETDDDENRQFVAVKYWMPLPRAPKGAPLYDDTVYEAAAFGVVGYFVFEGTE